MKLKEEILATEVEDLAKLSNDIQKVLEDDTVVVIGNKTQIEAEKKICSMKSLLYINLLQIEIKTGRHFDVASSFFWSPDLFPRTIQWFPCNL